MNLSNILSFKKYFSVCSFPLQWFNDVHSTDILDVCEDVLNLLSKSHGCEVSWSLLLFCSLFPFPSTLALILSCYTELMLLCFKTIEIVIPELHEMRTAHIVSIGSETICSLNPDIEDGYDSLLWNI